MYRLLAFFSLVNGGVVLGEPQECYTCRPPQELSSTSIEQQVLHQFPHTELPVCGQEPPAPRNCPPRYKGCLTQYHGELVVRLCGELKITACETANGIEYCYCEGRLCNGEEGDGRRRGSGGGREDDEDSEEEGSGSLVTEPPPPPPAPASAAALGPAALVAVLLSL